APAPAAAPAQVDAEAARAGRPGAHDWHDHAGRGQRETPLRCSLLARRPRSLDSRQLSPDGPWSQPQDKSLPAEDDHVEGHGAAGNVALTLRRPPEAERQLRGQLHFIEPEHEYLFGRMHVDAHAYSKAERQRLIGSLVARKRIGTQLEMLDALATSGC